MMAPRHLGALGLLAVVVHHGVVERVDAAKIFGVERMLGADLVGQGKAMPPLLKEYKTVRLNKIV